jgi:hypothetical protein
VACAYELATHGGLTSQAYQRSVLITDSTRLRDLGIDPTSVNPFGRVYYDVSGVQIGERLENAFERQIIQEHLRSIGVNAVSIPGWLMRGAIREDDSSTEHNPQDDPYHTNLKRPLHHFFDPYNNRPLTALGLSLLDPDVHTAPAWGLGTRNPFAQPNAAEAGRRNHFTVFDAREAMYRALTGRDSRGNVLQPTAGGTLTRPQDIRSAYWATMFRALGDVVHLVQDMGQPQHTRNDRHAGVLGAGATSVYEFYVDARARGETEYKIDGTTVTPQPLDYGSYPIPSFARYSDYFSTSPGAGSLTGNGLADYSNRGFFSAGTNLGSNSYASPSNDAASYTKESAAGLLPTRPLQRLNFLRGDVPDTLNAGSSANIRMTTESVFDLFLVSTPPTYSLNRLNYDDMAKLLIPRAVTYSTGLINYFFRGKLDFKKDDQDQTKFRIANLGPEAMNGRFALYYDAVDGNRYPVAVNPADPSRDLSDPNAWRLTIAALNPAVPNSNRSDVVSFIAPANDGSQTSPKVANEYMLVFNGNMGEEREDKTNGVLGAVAAKSITTPYNSALYLLGVDAAGQRVALRADKTGTRVVPANEFHPLRGITIPAPYQTLTKSYVTKQTAFTQHTFGYSYETLAATVGIHYPFYGAFATGWVKNSATGTFDVVGGVVWTAKSPDPLIGEFRFRPIVPESNPAAATLEYRRTYTDAAGNPQTFTGTIALPPIPGNQMNYLVFPQGLVYISGDGLAVSGFEKQLVVTGNPLSLTREDYDLRITLAEVPTLAFVKTGQRVTYSSNRTSRPLTTQITGTVTTTVPCDPPPPTILTGNVTTTDYLDDRVENIDEPRFIDYFNGALRSYRRVENSRQLISYLATGATMAGGRACSWVYLQTKGEAIDKFESDGGIVFGSGGTLVNFARSDQSGFQRPLLGAFNRSWDYRYEGLSPAPPIQYSPIPAPISTNMHDLVQAISDRVEDAVYSLQTTSGPAVVRFRIHDITNMWYVADSSPIGEVFFATADLSVVEHEPKRGPKVVIPPNVVRLLAAVWM